MATRLPISLLLCGVFASLGASYRTTNFQVEAPNAQIAKQVGDAAEYYRKEKALLWIGREMPPWPAPCPLVVRITMSAAGGATSFNFDNGQVWQRMDIEGPLDRVVASVLPHEVTHTVFAHYFRMPVPRWADEGGSVLSEDDLERQRHDQMVRQILAAGRAIPLARLFNLREYPRDVGSLYAEGYSVANFLVASSSRKTFLDFVAHGMQYGWDSAAKTHYHYENVNELENAWINHLKNTRRTGAALMAKNTAGANAEPVSRVVVRLTAPPVQPLPDAPPSVIRAQMAENERGGWNNPTRQPVVNRPGYLPESLVPPGTVRLGPPQFSTAPPSNRQTGSPVGYPD